MAMEIELKLLTSTQLLDQHLDTLCKYLHIDQLESFTLKNRYFDTPHLELKAKGIALRIRETNGTYIQTLKTAGVSTSGLHQRNEWEWEISSPELNTEVLQQLDVWPNEISAEILHPQFETNFLRQLAIINWQNTQIEWVVDQGSIIAQSKTEHLCEMELELKKGDSAKLFQVAEKIANIIPCLPSPISKAQRGYRLIIPAQPSPRTTPAYSDKVTHQEILQTTLSNWLTACDTVNLSGQFDDYLEWLSLLGTLKQFIKLSDTNTHLEALLTQLYASTIINADTWNEQAMKQQFINRLLLNTHLAGKLSITLAKQSYLCRNE